MKTAVIGAGNMGKHHVRIYSEISQLVAIADPFESQSKALASEYKTNYYKNYIEMLDSEEIDAVSVVVPTSLHKEVAIHCLRRKIPTFIEKPIASNLSDATAILMEAKKQNTFVFIGHIERFNPAVVKLKKMIDQGTFGDIISLLAIRVGINPPKTPSDVTFELAIHDIDIFNYFLSELPIKKTISKRKIFKDNIADSASLLLEYKSAIGMIQTNWITPIKMRRLYVTGTVGFAELDYINQKLIVYEKVIDKQSTENFLELLSLSDSPNKQVFISKKEPLREELRFFLKNRLGTDLTSARYAFEALKIALSK